MANHAVPTTSTAYASVLTNIKDRIDDAVKMMDASDTSPTNIPVGARRTSGLNVQRWHGTAWVTIARLNDPANGAALTNLGVSAFAQSLLDDANASAAMDTLGMSSTGKAVAVAVSQQAARAAIGTDYTNTVYTGSGTLTPSLLKAVARYTGSGGHTLTLPALTGGTTPVDAAVLVIHGGSGTLSIAAGHVSDSMTRGFGYDVTGNYVLNPGEIAEFRVMRAELGIGLWRIQAASCDKLELKPRTVTIDGDYHGLRIGDISQRIVGTLTINGDGSATKTANHNIAGYAPAQPGHTTFTVQASGFYSGGAQVRKCMTFNSYRTTAGTSWVLLSSETIGGGHTTDATNFPIATAFEPVIFGGQLMLRFAGRNSAPSGEFTKWTYVIDMVKVEA